MELLDEVIDGLNAINASERNDYVTDVELSETWLGMSPRYVSVLRAGQKPGLSCYTKLWCRLKKFETQLSEGNQQRKQAEIRALITLVFNEMNTMALEE